jgi:hypothetical protein
MIGNAIAPGFADRYLARTAFDAQQTDRLLASERPDNLFDALPGDRGAHGDFDAKAHSDSAQWILTRHRRGIGALSGLAGLAAAACARLRSR